MTTAAPAVTAIHARKAGFLSDVTTVAERALRSLPRDPEAVIPALVIPLFFFVMNVGALQKVAENIPGINYKAFQLPAAILFAVTGNSRAITIVTDIQNGYFDRLSITPVNRLALLLGLMVADFAMVVTLTIPVLIVGFAVGVRFTSGPLGILAFILLGGVWGLVFTGFPYAIALKTGNPAAVNVSFLLFFPFLFMTTLFLPQDALTGWLGTVAAYNPVTYMLAAMRSLISVGWQPLVLLKGALAIAGVAVVSLGLAFAALRGRTRRR